MVRRTLLAQLLEGWLSTLDRKLSLEQESQLAGLVKRLYTIHAESVEQRGVMEYLHISKSGGTSWSAAAKSHGCRVPRDSGCHVPSFHDKCRWIDPTTYARLTGGWKIMWGRWGIQKRRSPYQTCWQRYARVVRHGYSYISNEYTLMGGLHDIYNTHPCPQMVNVVTLREPLSRLMSNLKFMMAHFRHAVWRRKGAKDAEVLNFAAVFCNRSAALWEELAPPVADNYNVRSFLGERGFHTPVGGLTPEHTTTAKALLSQFDLVLDLGAGEKNVDRTMRQGVGWPATLAQNHRLNSSRMLDKVRINFTQCKPAELDVLFSRQGPDVELYSYGRVLAALDTLFMELAAALGLGPGPQLPQGDAAWDIPPNVTRCGMLHRGSHGSALAAAAVEAGMLAPEAVTPKDVVGGEGGNAPGGGGSPASAEEDGEVDGEDGDK